ncbi:hypothetical protein ACN6LM_004506 [Streptomyces sp. SAS_281]|uniref:hypothetical protein n=1 Tax=Streptomyces sp. SAS_281 TaxID=3412744 RepID=UPI00403C0A8C
MPAPPTSRSTARIEPTAGDGATLSTPCLPRLAALTRHLWAGTKGYEEAFHHYDSKLPVITTTLADLRAHGPHGAVFRRSGLRGPLRTRARC